MAAVCVVGDAVRARYRSADFYEARVAQINDTQVTVDWDDGTA
eukprot:gene45320-17068_t